MIALVIAIVVIILLDNRKVRKHKCETVSYINMGPDSSSRTASESYTSTRPEWDSKVGEPPNNNTPSWRR